MNQDDLDILQSRVIFNVDRFLEDSFMAEGIATLA